MLLESRRESQYAYKQAIAAKPDLVDAHRPEHLSAYGSTDLFALAAAYVNGILRNHPFIDGNKRTAFLAGYLFLARNDTRLSADEAEATEITVALASRRFSEEGFAG